MTFAATTGRLAGTIVDNTGVPLPGVTVTISSENLIGGPQVAITSVDGGFAFNLLPVGPYKVDANLSGFQAVTAEVRVTLDHLATINITMVPEQFAGEIEVTADIPVVDTTQVNTSVVFDEQYLQNAAVGTAGRDYLSIIGTAAGVAGTGNASVYGGSEGDNRYLVDGLNTSDPLLGTFGTNFNYDAIQEISFQTGGFEAEFGQATGGIINLVTKSGGNEFSGSFDARYRDQQFIENGDHFNRENQTSSSRIISATLGGPILRDRLWFFVSGENVLTQRQGAGVPVVREFKGWNYIGKATWQLTDNHRAVFKYSGDPADISGANASIYITPDASRTQQQGGWIGQAELNSVLTEAVLLNVQAGLVRGYIRSFPTSGDDSVIGHYNLDTGVTSRDIEFSSFDDRDRDELRANVSVFVDDFAGAHEVKFGGEYNKLFYGGAGWINGGIFASDRNPPDNFIDVVPDGYYTQYVTMKEPLATARDRTKSLGYLYTGFLQDSWRPIPNLTVKPGVRLDLVTMDNNIGERVADMNSWQPRLGVAWDIFSDAKHVVRASWGRFMDSTALSIPNFASGVIETYNEYNTMEYYCNTVGICDRSLLEAVLGPATEYTAPDGSVWVLWLNPDAAQVYEPAWTLDQAGFGKLKAPYADELIAAYEVQPFKDSSIEVTYVNKKTKDIIEDTCINNTWVWDSSVPKPSLDDPSTWTTNAGCTRYIITNHSDFYRKYEGYILKLETRKERFHLLANYTWSKSRGNTPNGARESYATALADFYPVHYVNQEGYMPDDRRHRIKVNGYLLLPYDITIGIDGFWSSAGHINKYSTCANLANATPEDLAAVGLDAATAATLVGYCSTGDGAYLGSTDIYLEPAGTHTTKPVWQLDLQVTKGFKVGRFDLQGVLTVENLFDKESDATFNDEAFITTPYAATTSWYQPRRYELGFRVEF